MPNVKFTTRLSDAVHSLETGSGIRSVPCRSGSLFSPVYRDGKYKWIKVMDSDGLLIARRRVHPGEGGDPSTPVSLLLGVVVQSEDATSQTKPNPLGKAALSSVPYGIWVDTNDGRQRLFLNDDDSVLDARQREYSQAGEGQMGNVG